MEKEQGFKYLVDGRKNKERFTETILFLTNLKSEGEGIINFRTFYGSTNIRIITDVDKDSYIQENIGDIVYKVECTIFKLDEHDIKEHILKELKDSIIKDEELHFEFDIY